MILTSITIPSEVLATDTFTGDYFEGDTIEMSFDASNPSDIAQLTSAAITTFGGETYAYANGTEYLDIPQIIPAVPGSINRYVKLRLHAIGADSASKGVLMYTKSSGKRRVTQTISDSEMGTTGLVSTDANAAGLDVIFHLLPANTTDKFALYVRPVGSNGEWTRIYEEKAYAMAAIDNIPLQIYNGLAVSSIKVYTKQTPEVEAVNKAANATEMETALRTYATTLGVDLSKLDNVSDSSAVYESLIDIVFYTAADVVAAFDAAVAAQQGAENVDCSDGDYIVTTFDASKQSDLDQLTSVEITTFGGETYAYASGADCLSIPQIKPGVPSAEPIYVKLRLHARSTSAAGNAIYVHTLNSQGKRAVQTVTDSEFGTTGMISADASAPGVDLIVKFNPNSEDGYVIYARRADSNGGWATINKAYDGAANVSTPLNVYSNLAISSAVVYKRVDASIAAFNAASKNQDAAAMEAALSTYATELGVDLTKLNEVENDSEVYISLFNLNVGTAAEIVAAFDAAVAEVIAQQSSDLDYNEGDYVVATFDASNPSDIAQLTSSDGSGVSTTTFGGETYAYTDCTTDGWLNIPQISPTVPSTSPIYVKLRLHALSSSTAGNGVLIYTTNSAGKRAVQTITDTELGTTGMVSADAAAAGIDIIFELNPETSDGYGIYVRPVGSEEEWTTVNEAKGYSSSTYYQALQIYNNLAISSAIVYTQQAPELAAVNKATTAAEMETALRTYATTLGVDLTKLDDVEDANAVYELLLDPVFTTAEAVVAAFNSAVASQRVLKDPDAIFAQNDKIYFSEFFDTANDKIVEYGNITVLGDGTAYAADRVDLYNPGVGSMAGKIMRIVFKPDNASSALNMSLYDDSGNRYYKALSGLPANWHETIAYIDADTSTISVWYRNIDADGPWQSLEVTGITNTGQTRVGILLITTGGVTYDEIVTYNGMYSNYAVTENGNTIELDGKLYHGTLNSPISRNAQFVFATYNKQYGYTSVDVSEASVVIPAKEVTVDRDYTYDASTENYAVMLWDSIDTGIILGEIYGYKTPNNLGDTAMSTLAEGEIVFDRHLNEAVVSGNVGINNRNMPISISIVDAGGTVVAVTQTTTNLKGAFEVNVGIDASNLGSGGYTVKVRCKDIVFATGTVELCGTGLNYNAIGSATDLATAIQAYVDAEILALFNQGNTIAYDKLLAIKGDGAFANFFEFKAALDEAVSYTVKLNQLLTDLNAAVALERWSDVSNLITMEYRDFLNLSENSISGINDTMSLFERMIRDENGLITYTDFGQIVDNFNAAVIAQKAAETPPPGGNNGGSSFGGGSSGGGGGNSYGFGEEIVEENMSSSENIEEMIEAIQNRKFKDLSEVPWAAESIETLYYNGIVAGDGSGYFHPGNNVKREEFLKMILKVAGVPIDKTGDLKFKDVDKNEWYFDYVNAAYQNGIINGVSDTEFGIGENITRADMMVMINRVIDKCGILIESIRPAIIFDDYKNIPSYARTSITTLYMAGLAEGTGDNMFNPGGTATKAEAAVAINRIFQLLINQ